MAESTQHKSVRLRLYGIVQGVGFRPFVYRIATKNGITGWVKNRGGFVEITACGEAQRLNAFFDALKREKPRHALIVYEERVDIPYEKFDSFQIIKSSDDVGPVFIAPDIAVCPDCMREMSDPSDRRYRHPFISCMSCGPRYSIIREAPYDRATTSMREFPMCEACETEYTDEADRRFHAQTVSCNDCGPQLIFHSRQGGCVREEALTGTIEAIANGGIVAVKGIGGYHLVCSPHREDTVLRLRELKAREQKPFAVMFPDIKSVREYCAVSAREEELLISDARPIVLLEASGRRFASAVSGKNWQVGAFLYYTPLQAMLLSACGPLVMTSANVSDEPIIKDEEPMLAWADRLEGILYHTREIVAREDDSVVKVVDGNVQTIRRSRGYAPLPVILKGGGQCPAIFAAGGHLKSTFCFLSGRFAYVGPYIGDLDGEGQQTEYRQSFERMKRIFRIKPEAAVCDLHPAYASTEFTRTLGLPILQVQHHHAHIASVMAEHGIEGPVIGVAFDGTGYGPDGAVWGGEFLICRGAGYERAGHIRYVTMLNGDEGMKDAGKSAMCYRHAAGLESVDERWPIIKNALRLGVNTHRNGGMGRMFDAVSACLGIGSYNRFEGECAIGLEGSAREALGSGIMPVPMSFEITEEEGTLVADSAPVFRTIDGREDTSACALGFHRAVAQMTLEMCILLRKRTGIGTVALSGGVFQNGLLLADVLRLLKEEGFHTLINREVPPNDGGISLGQAYIGQLSFGGEGRV